jgi:20S proteasome alpha/beta subunit
MTLNVCLKGIDGMVLATDSRGTFGDPRATTAQNDNMQKVYAISKYVGVLIAGSGELGSTIISEIQKQISERKTEGATPVMLLVREILISKFNEFFKGFLIQPIQGATAPTRPDLLFIVAGYDIDSNGKATVPKIYSLNCQLNFAPLLVDYGFALQGIAQYALYLLNRLYDPNSPIKNLLPLAAYVITETASQDGKVGGPVRMIKILPGEGCVTLNPEEINTIIDSNKDRSKSLKTSFFGEEHGPS